MEPILKLSYRKDCRNSWITNIITCLLLMAISLYNIIRSIINDEFTFGVIDIAFIVVLIVVIVFIILNSLCYVEIYKDKVIYVNTARKHYCLQGENLIYSFDGGHLNVYNKDTKELLRAYSFSYNKKLEEKLQNAGIQIVSNKK